jgi:hypothetical protein
VLEACDDPVYNDDGEEECVETEDAEDDEGSKMLAGSILLGSAGCGR